MIPQIFFPDYWLNYWHTSCKYISRDNSLFLVFKAKRFVQSRRTSSVAPGQHKETISCWPILYWGQFNKNLHVIACIWIPVLFTKFVENHTKKCKYFKWHFVLSLGLGLSAKTRGPKLYITIVPKCTCLSPIFIRHDWG